MEKIASGPGTVDFAVGQTTATFIVPVVADRQYESNEYFYVYLSNPVNCNVVAPTTSHYINNDDVRVTVATLSLPEGNTGMTDFVFTATLSDTYEFDCSVDWVTADGSAVVVVKSAARMRQTPTILWLPNICIRSICMVSPFQSVHTSGAHRCA